MTLINTFSGKKLDIENPNPKDICIGDIAHALSYICRGCGQSTVFFPVARHCVLCAKEAKARGYSNELIGACLLHDASEAYMTDVPRPIKVNLLPQYIKYEDNLLSCIYKKYIGRDLTCREYELVKDVDNTLLQYDLKFLLNVDVILPPLNIEPAEYSFEEFSVSEKNYLDFAKSLGFIS